MLHTAFEQARKWKLIAENPGRDATAPSPPRAPVRAFTAAEVQRLLAAAAGDRVCRRRWPVVVTGLGARNCSGWRGMRSTLMPGPSPSRRAVIEVGAARRYCASNPRREAGWRTIGLSAGLVDLLRAQKTHVLETALAWGKGYQRDRFSASRAGAAQPMQPMDMTLRLRQVMRQAKVADRQPTHGWRHTSATLLIHSGENVKTVQTRLGHSTPAITMALYVHPAEEPTARQPSSRLAAAGNCQRSERSGPQRGHTSGVPAVKTR